MANPVSKQLTIFPDMPRGTPFTDENGNAHPLWLYFFDQLSNALQINLKPEGYVIPPQSNTNINSLTGVQSANNVIYNSTNLDFEGNLPLPSGSATPRRWIPFAMITHYAGNPNSHVAGQLYWFCWDTSGNNLYICTTAGNEAGAVWTTVFSGASSLLLLGP